MKGHSVFARTRSPVCASIVLVAWSLGTSATLWGGEPAPQPGPIVKAFGAVYAVERPDFPTPTDEQWKVVFDVSVGAETPDALNPRIETVARFLNMHAQAGVAPEKMRATLVLHGTAGNCSRR